MRRLTLRAAVALITCLLGISAASLWNALDARYAPEAAPAPEQVELGPVAGTTSQLDEQEIQELYRQYGAAQTRHDAAFFRSVEADSFILTDGGTTLPREQDIADMMASPKGVEYTDDDVRVQFYGNVAVVTGRMTARHVGKEDGYTNSWRWLDVLVKRGGRWQILSTTNID